MNSRHIARHCIAFSVVISALVGSTSGEEAVSGQSDPQRAAHLETLRQHDIEPSVAGARRYLRQLLPDKNQRDQVQRLIAELGDDAFQTREAAMNRLVRMPSVPVDLLHEAALGANPEIRWRARTILEEAEDQSAHVMLAALKIASSAPGEGLVRDILAVLPLCGRTYLREAAHEALRAVASEEDAPLLLAALRGEDDAVRAAAVIGLTGALAPNHSDVLQTLLDDDDNRVSLEAARGLGNLGDRKSLAAFTRLLESADVQIRAESIAMLQGLTGQTLGFAPYLANQERQEAVARWQEWLKNDSGTAALRFPVDRRRDARGDLNGNTLVAAGSARRVFELDPTGKEVWRYEIDAWSAEKLENGNVLIASYSENKVVEVDAKGKVVWSLDSVRPISAMTAKPLPGGNILVADFSGKKVIEFTHDKREVWSHDAPGECFDAARLLNGNTLIGCPNLIREVRPDHSVVRDWEISGRLNGFCALDNGNVIVANYGANKIYEMRPDGSTVWEFDEPQPCDVFQLPDGKLLVTTASRVVEVSADHRKATEICKTQYGSARR